MLSLLASANQGFLQSKLYKTQARALRANAKGIRNRADAQSAALQKAAQDNQLLAAENLTTQQANKRAAEATLRTSQAYSGFDADKDSGKQAMVNLQQQLDAEIANMERAASISLLNSWQKSTDIRNQAELEAYSLESQANQYDTAAKSARKGTFLSLVSGALNAAYGFRQGYDSAVEVGAEDPLAVAYSSAAQAGNSAFHFVNSFNPYTGALSADANNRKNNWGGVFSVLAGNVPYKIPSAGTIFAQY